jgi:hypothetical protein
MILTASEHRKEMPPELSAKEPQMTGFNSLLEAEHETGAQRWVQAVAQHFASCWGVKPMHRSALAKG